MSDCIIKYGVLNERNQFVSGQYRTEQEAINDAQDLNVCGREQFAVSQLIYENTEAGCEYTDTKLTWTPDGLHRWPPLSDAAVKIGGNGEFQFQCSVGLCHHIFDSSELVPGPLFCPRCGNTLQVSKDSVVWTPTRSTL